MAVAHNHASVHAIVSCRTCRNYLKLCTEEILLLNAILLLENTKHCCFNALLCLLIILLVIFLLRYASNKNIKILPFYNLSTLLLHLLSCKVNKKICHSKYRIIHILSDNHIDCPAILESNNTMHCKRKRNPLILLNSAIIMRIKKSHIRILI